LIILKFDVPLPATQPGPLVGQVELLPKVSEWKYQLLLLMNGQVVVWSMRDLTVRVLYRPV